MHFGAWPFFIAGVGGGVKPLVRKAQSNRHVVAPNVKQTTVRIT